MGSITDSLIAVDDVSVTGVSLNKGSVAFFKQLSVQRQFPGRVVLDASYTGTRGTKLPVSQEFDAVPRKYLSTSSERDQDTINCLSAQITHPFAKIPEFAGTDLRNQRLGRSAPLSAPVR